MAKRIVSGIALVLIALAAVVLVRTLLLSYDLMEVEIVDRHDFDADGAVDRLATALTYPTISHQAPGDFDAEAFEGFLAFLEEAYPRIYAELSVERVGEYTTLYRWEGSDPELQPGMLIGHYDVVPVEPGTEDEWTHPPFAGAVADGFVWGRGTLDDKAGVLSALEAVAYLLETGFAPARTLYIAAHHDEEVGGLDGAAQVAALLQARGVELAFLVDEGLPVAEQVIDGIDTPLALVGVAEKGFLNLELSVARPGGHSSMPSQQTSIGDLATALHRLKDHPMPGRFGDLVQQTFAPLASELPFLYRMGLTNLWLFRPLVKRQLATIPHANAALRTTAAPTIFRAGVKENVLPARASAIVNFRIHPHDSIAAVEAHVKRVVANDDILIRRMPRAREPSEVSDTEAPAYYHLRQSIQEVFSDTPVAPSIFIATSDARHFRELTQNIYRFRPIRARPEDQRRIHGTNERIGVDNYAEMVQFQIRLIMNSTS
ncbi:MAG: M20 family peptidase [Bacteroidetes bacterium]|jgi:carboxypeptidase PM20D1|nr:M20 family peptidase [Bacteroidota bacterium]